VRPRKKYAKLLSGIAGNWHTKYQGLLEALMPEKLQEFIF
jgi:hypothetical protein